MTVYQELQLNQAGSKGIIRSSSTRSEKLRHTAIYLFKIMITLAFCMAFVIFYSTVFGSGNSIAGVAVLLCIMVFRFADFGYHAAHSTASLFLIFGILAFGPRLANTGTPLTGLIVNLVCIFLIMVLGCHNVIMFNHSTLVLAYLLLYGYDTSGSSYLLRVVGIALGAVLTAAVFYRNHKKYSYTRSFRTLLQEFDIRSMRTRWQLTVTLGVSTVIFLAESFHIPRAMWAGIAAMSVLLPFHLDIAGRAKARIPGNIAGGLLFLLLYPLLPEALHPYIGVLGGIGVGLSATYGWQAVFNSLGAMAIAVSFLGVPGAVFFRIFNNAFGALYGVVFHRIFQTALDRLTAVQG